MALRMRFTENFRRRFERVQTQHTFAACFHMLLSTLSLTRLLLPAGCQGLHQRRLAQGTSAVGEHAAGRVTATRGR